MKKSSRDFLSATTAAGVLLTACAPAVAPSDEPEAAAMPEATVAPAEEAAAMDDGGTLTFATGSPWGTYSPFRPTYQYGNSSNTPAMLTHSRLFDLDRNNDTHPNLATEWEVSDDAATYTFKLREDAK